MFDQFTQLVSDASGWAYAIIFVLALLDALVPVVPSETSVITAGVVASSGDLSVPLVVAAAAAGAFAGDNTAYLLGRRFGRRIEARFFRGERGGKQIRWAERQLDERGGELIVIGRFIPGGRTAVTLSAGTLGFRGAASRCSTQWPRSAGRSTRRCSGTSAVEPSSMRRGRGFCSRSRSRSPWQAGSS